MSVVSENIAVVVMRPDCESKNQSIKISSNTLDVDSQAGESSLVLPVSVFGESLDEECSEVGVVAIVYGGTGPDLLSLAEEFIPKSNCTPTPPDKAHGRWSVMMNVFWIYYIHYYSIVVINTVLYYYTTNKMEMTECAHKLSSIALEMLASSFWKMITVTSWT